MQKYHLVLHYLFQIRDQAGSDNSSTNPLRFLIDLTFKHFLSHTQIFFLN